MARGIRDTRALPGDAENRRADAAAARNQLRTASLEDIASEYQRSTTRQRDRLMAEVRRRGVTNDEWQAANNPGARSASSPSAAGTGNS